VLRLLIPLSLITPPWLVRKIVTEQVCNKKEKEKLTMYKYGKYDCRRNKKKLDQT